MKRLDGWLALGAALALATPALAGGGHKCTKSAAACKEEMTAHYKAKGWAGLEMDKTQDKAVVKAVVAGSPAEAAGIQPGDVLLAINGASLSDKEAVYKVKKTLAVGSQVTYTLARGGVEQKASLTLAPVPETVLAQWVNEHLKEHVASN